MKVGDIVFWHDDRFGHHRFWQIKGVYCGAEDTESVVELLSLTEKPGSSTKGHATFLHETTFVPEPLLRNLPIYTPDIALRTHTKAAN